MKLEEIFDTSSNLPWQTYNNYLLTSFKMDNIEYIIQIENKPLFNISKNLLNKKTAEISFFVQGLNDIDAFSTLDNNSKSLKIYGIVFNALVPKIKDYDAIVISINNQHSSNQKEYKSKKRIYKFLMDRMKSFFGNFVYEYTDRTLGLQYIISKERLILNESLRCTPLEMISKLIPEVWIEK
jgi:hypothetical protein